MGGQSQKHLCIAQEDTPTSCIVEHSTQEGDTTFYSTVKENGGVTSLQCDHPLPWNLGEIVCIFIHN